MLQCSARFKGLSSQAGGQPADQGVIVAGSTRFTVSDVRKDVGSGEIRHFGVFEYVVLRRVAGHLRVCCGSSCGSTPMLCQGES